MKCHWLFQSDIFDEHLNEIQDAVREQNMDFVTVDYKPFCEQNLRHLFGDDTCVVSQISLNLARVISKTTSWCPGVYADLNKFKCSHYYVSLGQFLLNNDYIMLPFGEISRKRDDIFDIFTGNSEVFVRPDTGFKTFTGQTLDYDDLILENVEQSDIVVISSKKTILREWRLVVVNHKIVAASQYKENFNLQEKIGASDEVIQFGNKIARTWEPESCWTLDIGELEDGSLGLIEINSFSCSGLYECNKGDVVREVSRAALADWRDLHEISTD